ncbi:hypothetical protein ACI5MQ_004866 [Salmonella enterica subsp. enterica serovar Anatum]
MTQYFDDIQISDKGMIKLIRNTGKDYIFPASNIIQVYRVKPYVHPDSWIPAARAISNLFGSDAFKETRPDTVCLKTKDGELYVRIPFTDELYQRIDDAHTYSTRRAESKYGKFK